MNRVRPRVLLPPPWDDAEACRIGPGRYLFKQVGTAIARGLLTGLIIAALLCLLIFLSVVL